jgi:hypothetical protein
MASFRSIATLPASLRRTTRTPTPESSDEDDDNVDHSDEMEPHPMTSPEPSRMPTAEPSPAPTHVSSRAHTPAPTLPKIRGTQYANDNNEDLSAFHDLLDNALTPEEDVEFSGNVRDPDANPPAPPPPLLAPFTQDETIGSYQEHIGNEKYRPSPTCAYS